MRQSSFTDLRVWREAMSLATEIYSQTISFPKHETYALTQQVRRAAVSVPSNIAEGKGRGSAREFRQFLYQARGSLLELQTQLMIAENLHYLSEQQAKTLLLRAANVGKILSGLINAIGERITTVRQQPTPNNK